MATVKQMRDYLRIATQMEADVYAAKVLVSKLSGKINNLNSVEYYTETDYMEDEIRNKYLEKKKKKFPFIVKFFIFQFVIGTIFLLLMFAMQNESGVLLPMIAGVVPIIVIVCIISVVKRKSAKENRKYANMAMNLQLKNSNEAKEHNEALLINYDRQLNDAMFVLNTAQENLYKLYSENILPGKYRNLVAVATMCQWLNDGRCTEIYGHGGLYDTYEYDLRLGQIVGKLDEISSKLDVVISNQNMLYDEVKRGNDIAEKTYMSVCNIEKNTERILTNSEAIKTNTDIMAMNSSYQSRLQEYMYYRSLYY